MTPEEPDDDDLDMEETGFDDFEGGKKTLGDLWRDNPMVKVGTIAAGIVLVLIIIVVFGAKQPPPDPSVVPKGSDVTSPPGGEDVSPTYIDAVKEENEGRVEEAVKEGGSALPTPIEPPLGRLTEPEQEKEDQDPLQRWRQLQEERLQRELQQTQVSDGKVQEEGPTGEDIQAMSEAMSTQMQAILESLSQESALKSMAITDPGFLEQLAAEKEAEAEGGGATGADGEPGAADGTKDITLFPAGQIAYAQMLTEANTDVPGPVLAQIVSGPLAGNRILGTFEQSEELLTLNFDTVIIDGVAVDMDAIALDPETTLPGLATDVDHRYLRRVLLPMAAAFVEGAASAISESGTTSVTVQGDTVVQEESEKTKDQQVASGIEEAGQELRDILEETADETRILVRIETGTPFALLFLSPVVQTVEDPEAQPAQ